jgi:hypothetical protein
MKSAQVSEQATRGAGVARVALWYPGGVRFFLVAWLILVGVAGGGASSGCGKRQRAASGTAKALTCAASPRPWVCLVGPVTTSARPPQRGPGPVARHVIIISEDGLRPDALMNVKPPNHSLVMKKGAFSLTARTIRHASTLPSHAAMLSGFDEKEHGLKWNSWRPERGFIQVPTIFDAANGAGLGAASFVGKWKLQHITPPGSVDVFARPGFFCKKVVEQAARYFIEKKPQVEFVHFSDPDERGHAVGWMSGPQLETIRHTDLCLGTLLAAVATAGVEKETLFILSSDHGGHGRNHSGRIEEDRLIPWVVWGAGVRSGHQIKSPVSTVDTAATARWALGHPQSPGAVGRPVKEAFTDAAQAAAAQPHAPVLARVPSASARASARIYQHRPSRLGQRFATSAHPTPAHQSDSSSRK